MRGSFLFYGAVVKHIYATFPPNDGDLDGYDLGDKMEEMIEKQSEGFSYVILPYNSMKINDFDTVAIGISFRIHTERNFLISGDVANVAGNYAALVAKASDTLQAILENKAPSYYAIPEHCPYDLDWIE